MTELRIDYEDGSFVQIDAPRGMPGPRFPGYLDVLLFYGQRELFSTNTVEYPVYQIFKQLGMDPNHGSNYTNFRHDMRKAFALGLETDRFRHPQTGERSHVYYFRVLQRMVLAKHHRGVSTFVFDDLFLASLRASYLKRLNFDFCLWLDKQQKPLARFLYGHLAKRLGNTNSIYVRKVTGFLRDVGLGYVAALPLYRRNAALKETVFPALDLLVGELLSQYASDTQEHLVFLPKRN